MVMRILGPIERTPSPELLQKWELARQYLVEHRISRSDYFELKGQVFPLSYNTPNYELVQSGGLSYFAIGDSLFISELEQATPDLPNFVYQGLSDFFSFDANNDGVDEIYFAVTTLRDLGPLNVFLHIPKTDYYAIDLATIK